MVYRKQGRTKGKIRDVTNLLTQAKKVESVSQDLVGPFRKSGR